MSTIESNLREIAAGRGAEDLAINYSDIHPLWGGVSVTLTRGREYERTVRQPGGASVLVRRQVTRDEVASLVQLLVKLGAWEQRIPERAPVPDESRATLTIQCGATQSSIWEWYNDLSKHQRLARIRDRLLHLGDDAVVEAAPNDA